MQLGIPYKDELLRSIGDNAVLIKLVDANKNVLSEIKLATPSYSEINNGIMRMHPTQAVMLLESGVLASAEILDSSGVTVATLSIGGSDSFADLRLPIEDATVFRGAMFSIQDWSIS